MRLIIRRNRFAVRRRHQIEQVLASRIENIVVNGLFQRRKIRFLVDAVRVERCAVVTQQIEFAVRRADEVVVNLAERGIRKRDKRPERGEFFITGVVVLPRDLRKRQL